MAYAVALDALNTITRPIAISPATNANSHASGGASPVRKRAVCGGALPPPCAALTYTRRPVHRRDERFAARFGRGEHVERRAARREQHDVAGAGERGGGRDGLVHRSGV